MNLQDQVLFRCIHAACARPLARRVNFCPYCGTPQREGMRAPDGMVPLTMPPPLAPVPVPTPTPTPSVATPAASPAQAAAVPPVPASARVEPTLESAASEPARVTARVAPLPGAAPAAPAAVPTTSTIPPVPPKAGTPRSGPMAPPQRAPIRMRYWIIALVSLWLIWLYAKPNPRKLEPRVAEAVVMSRECRLTEAQSELIALRGAKATDEQLRRIQSAMNSASPGCEKKRLRAKAWSDTTAAVETALEDDERGRALSRLNQFTRKWGEDAASRALKTRIGPVAPPAPREPARSAPAAPSGDLAREVLSVRNLIAEAERDVATGNYQSASRRMESCIAMIPGGSRECAAYKVYVDGLLRGR